VSVKTSHAILAAGVLAAFAFLASGRTWPPAAYASVGPGRPQNVNVTCLAAGNQVAAAYPNMQSIVCECTAAVSWGGSGVDDTTDYSSTTFAGNVKELWCEAASVACRCVAMVPG
jgi:hypothetical protein